MATYQISDGNEYVRGSSDTPLYGSKHANTSELDPFEIMSESVNSLRVLNPDTLEFDKEKTNAARKHFIETKTKLVSTQKKISYFRKIEIDNDGLIQLFFDKMQNS